MPAALPARNAPPAPQQPPAWLRNGDSPAPCSHPLIVHPPQPTTGLAAGFPASQPLLGLLLLPALPILQSPPISCATEPDGTSPGVLRPPFPGLCILWTLALGLRILPWDLASPAAFLTPERLPSGGTPSLDQEHWAGAQKKEGVM